MRTFDNTQGHGTRLALGFRETFRRVHFLKSLKSLHALVALLTLLGLTNGTNAAPVTELKILSFNSVTAWPSDHRAFLSSFVLGPRR